MMKEAANTGNSTATDELMMMRSMRRVTLTASGQMRQKPVAARRNKHE